MNTRFRTPRLMEPEGDGAGGAAGAPPAGMLPAAAPPPAGHGIAWLPADVDSELVGHVQNKGWTSAADAAKAHRAAEQLIGADRAGRTVTLPSGDDPVEWGKVFDRMGRPANADGYQIKGDDPAMTKAIATKFHELGIPLKAGQALSTWFSEQVAATGQVNAQAEAAAFQADNAALDAAWGGERAARTEFARRAAQQLGVKPETVAAIEKAGGFAETLKLFAKMGDMLKEHGAEGLAAPGSYGMTPEGAKAKKTQLMADKDWSAKARVANSAEFAELTRLNKLITGEAA